MRKLLFSRIRFWIEGVTYMNSYPATMPSVSMRGHSIYAIAAFISGVVLSVVFQLAHCVEEAEFPLPVAGATGDERMQTEWAVHQVQTTVDFARGNRFLCWFLGGLNFQIEHHLFSKICHIHYPALSKVVEEACQEFGIRYAAHRTFWSAVASHYSFLVQMGKPT